MRIAVFVMALVLSGCATMVRGTSQRIEMTSDPPGATVEFRGVSCVTPCTLEAERSSRPAMVRFTLDGREQYFGEIAPNRLTVADDPGLLPVAFVSGLLIVPGIVDLSSNTLYDRPENIHAFLPEKGHGGAMLDVKRKPDSGSMRY